MSAVLLFKEEKISWVSAECELNCSTRALATFSFTGRYGSAHSQTQAASALVKNLFRE